MVRPGQPVEWQAPSELLALWSRLPDDARQSPLRITRAKVRASGPSKNLETSVNL